MMKICDVINIFFWTHCEEKLQMNIYTFDGFKIVLIIK